jgi:hypothetical protein
VITVQREFCGQFRTAGSAYYSTKLANSTNKPKTTRNIIKTITNNQKKSNSMIMMEVEGKLTTHHQTIAEKFNTYYIPVADNITNIPAQNATDDSIKNDPPSYLYSAFQQSFSSIKLKNTPNRKIEKNYYRTKT